MNSEKQFIRRQAIAVIIVLVIELAGFFIQYSKTHYVLQAVTTSIQVAVLVGLLSVIILSAESSFGEICDGAIGAIATVEITCWLAIMLTKAKPGILCMTMLIVGIIIVFGLANVVIKDFMRPEEKHFS